MVDVVMLELLFQWTNAVGGHKHKFPGFSPNAYLIGGYGGAARTVTPMQAPLQWRL